MSMSKRFVSLNTLQRTNWASIFNTDKRRSNFVLPGAYCYELTLTHKDMRPLPNLEQEAEERIWDSSPMIPHYYDAVMMEQELTRISEHGGNTKLIPIISVGGEGDSTSARNPVSNEWLQVVVLPTDWFCDTRRELEIQWIVGEEKRIQNRYRREDTPRTLAGQMPTDYWGKWELDKFEIVFESKGFFSVKVVDCQATAHVQDDEGVAVSDSVYTDRSVVVGQLDNGIVLWWQSISRRGEHVIKDLGDHVEIDGRTIDVFTGAVDP